MEDDGLLLGTPAALLVLWALRRFLNTAERLPLLDRRMQRLWVPALVLWLSYLLAGKRLHLNGDLLDDAFLLVTVAHVGWAAWQLRAYAPARTVGLALAPYGAMLLLVTALHLLAPKLLETYEDGLDTTGFVVFCWGVGMLFAARSQKKRLAIEEQRRADEAREQQRIVAKNTELEQVVLTRTAALRQQTDELQAALDELRTTQKQLIQAEKMASLGELTAGIAHEIQNPLNFVNNFAEVSSELAQELAQERARPTRDPELEAELLVDLQQNMQKITQHGKRAASIVRGMLEHSRASTGERTRTDLNALCEEYLRLAYHGLRAKDKGFNATLQTDFAPVLPLVEAVSQDLGRVLLNLFTNAFYAVRQRQQAAEPGYQPTVSVRTFFADRQVNVVVHDNGTGIPEAVKAKIFQPFFTTKPSGEGTGLGLSLSYDIVVQGHDGEFEVASQEGQGSTFTVRLPV